MSKKHKWSSDAPPVPGWYWHRGSDGYMCPDEIRFHKGEMVVMGYLDGDIFIPMGEDYDGEWWPVPIKKPSYPGEHGLPMPTSVPPMPNVKPPKTK